MHTSPKTIMAATMFAATLAAQIPAVDSRNVALRHTDFQFTMPKYATLEEWEAHKAHLKRQILIAAGLFPMGDRTPVHAAVSGRLEREGYTIEKVALETMPGYYLGGNLYRP